MKLYLSRARIISLVRWVTVISFLLAAIFMARIGNWVIASKSIKMLADQGPVKDVWFANDRELFILQDIDDGRVWLKKWDIASSKFSDVRTIDLRRLPKLHPDLLSAGRLQYSLFVISRDGMRIAWVANGQLCTGFLGPVGGPRCEQSIGLSLWREVVGLSFFGGSGHVLGVVYRDGRFRVFDMMQGENTNRPGSEFMGPWSLRSQGEAITALPEPNTGSFGCIQMIQGKIDPFTPDLSPLRISAVSAIDCRQVVVGTANGYVLPQSRDKPPGPTDAYGKLGGGIEALAVRRDGTVFAAGEFSGIYMLKMSSLPQKVEGAVESVSGVRLLDAADGYLAYLSDVPVLVELGSEWRPTSWNSFVANIVVIAASLLGFLYTLVVERFKDGSSVESSGGRGSVG